MESNGQALLRLAVKWSSSLAEQPQTSGQEHETLGGQPAEAAAQRNGANVGVANEWVKGSMAQICRGQAVKEHF